MEYVIKEGEVKIDDQDHKLKIVDEFWLQVMDEFEKIELVKNPSEEKKIGS